MASPLAAVRPPFRHHATDPYALSRLESSAASPAIAASDLDRSVSHTPLSRFGMEQVHGIDVSWMTHGGTPKDRVTKASRPRDTSISSITPQTAELAQPSTPPPSSPVTETPAANGKVNDIADARPSNGNTEVTTPKPVVITRPARSASVERPGPNGTPPQRRGSWFSNISSKFSSSSSSSPNNNTAATTNGAASGGGVAGGANGSGAPSSPTVDASPTPKQPSSIPPRAGVPVKNAVLQHATKHEGEGPYTPAPPRSGQAGFLGVFRRLSSSSGVLGPPTKGSHGLVERKVLNVDQNRERCKIPDLNQSKLRRVAFSVDVEIAPMPKYADPEPLFKRFTDKTTKKKAAEKGEGEALKHPKAVETQKERDGEIKATGESVPKEPAKEGSETTKPACEMKTSCAHSANGCATALDKEKDSKKKEKKKKSEEERKARKEKKRKLAEANGTIPMEIHLDDSDSSSTNSRTPGTGTPKTTSSPTTNPVRIYRRCCQLRETPILKKITEQLTNSANTSSETGLVYKLDLTGYWLQLPDLITLGDYLAIVPVREVILENCGLTDEGLRVILAGLLTAKAAGSRRRKHVALPVELSTHGGVVERLVLKNNKIGPEGWKHICLFIYLCRSIKHLDLSCMHFPRQTQSATAANGHHASRLLHSLGAGSEPAAHNSLASLFSKAIGSRLAGPALEVLSIGDVDPTSEELGTIIDGIIQCGVKRLGLAHNHLDAKGREHVARYLSSGICEGLDLGGNDLREGLEVLANSIADHDPLWAISLADCNLIPSSLCKILPKLAKLGNLRFIDLSHNQDLCKSTPSALGLLRKYLPKLQNLKRIHLIDVAMTSEQAIALAEILPEVPSLAHINLLENPELVKLADAKTEEAQEEACALYASLLAATRVSKTIICVDLDVPSEESSEIVKALAKQVVAYCLRNMEAMPVGDTSTALAGSMELASAIGDRNSYPDVLAHLVGHDVFDVDEIETDNESAPDEDYVIGGTGVVKALACCLKNNRGDDSRRASGEFSREPEDEISTPTSSKPHLVPGKAKDMSKHLLAGARKIRVRLQPALAKARANPSADEQNFRKLLFLDDTLAGIIKRFEDEFPETRVQDDGSATTSQQPSTQSDQRSGSLSSTEQEEQVEHAAALSDAEDENELLVRPSLSRSNSVISHTSKRLADEEGKALRVGHKFRSSIIGPEQYDLMLGNLDEIDAQPQNVRILQEMLEDIGNEHLLRLAKEKGILGLSKDDRHKVREALKELDPEHWERFIESQEKARANVQVGVPGDKDAKQQLEDESAIAD